MEKTASIKYCLYARKSSEQDERQAMSIDSQLKEMMDMAKRENLNVVETRHESHSAKESGKRPVFNSLVDDIRHDKFQGILTWAPDRLSRNAGDLGILVDLMDQNRLQQIRTYGQSFSNTPNEKFLLMILCSQAKLENDNKSVNVKRGIRAKCAMGIRPGPSPLGYFNRSFNGIKDVAIDPERGPMIKEMFERSANGQSGRHIKHWLDESGFRTRRGKKVTLSSIYEILNNPFYYGEFMFGEILYKGTQEPLITKELFDVVQEQLIVPQKSKWGSKDFPLKRFLKCASCGATIVGEEKYKQLKNGSKNRHMYYHCSRTVDYNCKEPFIREEVLIQELLGVVDRLTMKEADVEPGLLRAMNKFGSMTGLTAQKAKPEALLHAYAKYVLRDGTEFELTRLIRNLRTEFGIRNRTIVALHANRTIDQN